MRRPSTTSTVSVRRAVLALLLGVTAVLAGASFVTPASAPPARATSTPPPTPVPPNGSPSPFPTELVTPSPSLSAPQLTSRAAVLEDLDSGQILYTKAARDRRPIASLTKIMTAVVVMSEASPDETVVVSANAAGQSGSSLGLVPGERIEVRQLLYALLLQSSNDAAVALAEHVGGSVDGFLYLMNVRARDLGMTDTFFTSPSGLDDSGYSSARDLALVTRAAFADPLFERIVRTKFHDVPAPTGPPRHIQNRNILLWLYPWSIGVKTGFTTPAGHCLIAAADRDGLRMLVVALGSPGTNAAGVFNDGAALLNYGYGAFQKEPLIHAGDAVGPFTVQGVPVPAVSAATLVQFVRRDLLETVAIQVRMAAGLSLPIRAGSRIGSVVVTVDGKRAGTVDVVAVSTVSASPPGPPPEPPPPRTPSESLGRLVQLFHDLIQAVVGPFL